MGDLPPGPETMRNESIIPSGREMVVYSPPQTALAKDRRLSPTERTLAIAAEQTRVLIPRKGGSPGEMIEVPLIGADGQPDPEAYRRLVMITEFVARKAHRIDEDIPLKELERFAGRELRLQKLEEEGRGRVEQTWLRLVIAATREPSPARELVQRTAAAAALVILSKWVYEDGTRALEAATQIPSLVGELAKAKIDVGKLLLNLNPAGLTELFSFKMPAWPNSGNILQQLADYGGLVAQALRDQTPRILARTWEGVVGPAVQAYDIGIALAAKNVLDKLGYAVEETKRTAVWTGLAFADSLLFPFWRKIVMSSAPVVRLANLADSINNGFKRFRGNDYVD